MGRWRPRAASWGKSLPGREQRQGPPLALAKLGPRALAVRSSEGRRQRKKRSRGQRRVTAQPLPPERSGEPCARLPTRLKPQNDRSGYAEKDRADGSDRVHPL
jgi:hypothetical protein